MCQLSDEHLRIVHILRCLVKGMSQPATRALPCPWIPLLRRSLLLPTPFLPAQQLFIRAQIHIVCLIPAWNVYLSTYAWLECTSIRGSAWMHASAREIERSRRVKVRVLVENVCVDGGG